MNWTYKVSVFGSGLIMLTGVFSIGLPVFAAIRVRTGSPEWAMPDELNTITAVFGASAFLIGSLCLAATRSLFSPMIEKVMSDESLAKEDAARAATEPQESDVADITQDIVWLTAIPVSDETKARADYTDADLVEISAVRGTTHSPLADLVGKTLRVISEPSPGSLYVEVLPEKEEE